jgi:hypothetical protein
MGADMPDTVRHFLRVNHHPARSVECPHCGAHAHRPCTTRSKRRLLTDAPVHPARVTEWARATAVCPTCQVEPGVACRLNGYALPGDHVHATRTAEAEVTAA